LVSYERRHILNCFSPYCWRVFFLERPVSAPYLVRVRAAVRVKARVRVRVGVGVGVGVRVRVRVRG